MIDEVNSLVSTYVDWLKDKTMLATVEEYVEITTPFLDRHNDYLQIYVKKTPGGYLLTDDAYTISDLELSGCILDSPKRKKLLEVTLNGFSVKQDNKALTVQANEQNFSIRKHNLLQAMMAVNDLFYLAASTTKSLFLEDVMRWLDKKEIRYTPQVKFTGKSGYDHHFDFVIPRSSDRPERLLSTINRPSKSTAESMLFAWTDTLQVRDEESQAYAILNNTSGKVDSSIIEAFENYKHPTILWSNRESFVEELAG